MTRKKINILIGIMVACIAIFYAGTFAYENYMKEKSDQQYSESLDDEISNKEQENQSGQTNAESKK